MSIQLLTSIDTKLIDSAVENFYLAGEYLERMDVIPKIGKNYRSLKSNIEPELYQKRYFKLLDLSKMWSHKLGEQFNKYYNISLDNGQWEIILCDFLMPFIFDIYDKYNKYNDEMRGKNILHNRYEISTAFQTTGIMSWYFMQSLDFHSEIWGKILSYFGEKVCIKPQEKKIVKKKALPVRALLCFFDNPEKFRIKINDWIKSKKGNHLRDAEILDLHGEILLLNSRMPKELEKKLIERSNGRIVSVDGAGFGDCTKKVMDQITININGRKKVFSDIATKNEFDSLLKYLLPDFMPLSIFEGIPDMLDKAEKICGSWNFRKIYHSALGSDIFSYCKAIERKKNSIICDIQHSAAYGGIEFLGYKEYQDNDRFLTWGWKHPVNQNVYPVAMSRLPSKQNTKKQTGKILLAAAAFPELMEAGRGWYYGAYNKRQKAFISALSEEMRKRLVIRTSMNDEHTDLRIWCKEKYPEIQFEDCSEISFTDSLLESSLLVCDYYGSPHLEALMLGRPFVMYEGVLIIKYSAACVPYLETMEKLGIYKKDGEELAKEISSHPDFEEWLQNPGVKKVLDDYKNEMTGADKNTLDVWYQEIISA